MATTILSVLTFVLLTAGLTLHGIYLESKIDLASQPDATQCRTQSNRASSAGSRGFPRQKGGWWLQSL